MKKILVLFIGVLVLGFFGCVKVEQSDAFGIVDAKIFNVCPFSAGVDTALLRFTYKFDPQVESVNMKRDMFVNNEHIKINGSISPVRENPTLRQDEFSMMIFLPKGATSAKVAGTITALFQNGPVQVQFEPKDALPVSFR